MNINNNTPSLVSTTQGWEDNWLTIEPYDTDMTPSPIEQPGKF